MFRFVIANDEFKFKEYNIDSKLCRKTTIAPRFGTPPARLLQVPIASASAAGQSSIGYFAFAASSRVIGIGTFPLTGDPSKVPIVLLSSPQNHYRIILSLI